MLQQFFTSICYRQLDTTSLQFTHTQLRYQITSITYRQLGTTSLQFTHTQLQTTVFNASQSEWLNINTVTYHS